MVKTYTWVHELFEEQAERNPERIALIGAGQALSYGELNRRANRVGNYLRDLGVGPEALVGLCLRRSVEMVVGLLGSLKACGAYLPLDPELPLERLSFMLEDAGVAVILTERKLERRLPAFWGHAICLDEEWEQIGQKSEVIPENGRGNEVGEENLAYVIYTSGSSGRPKGVMIHHGGLLNYLKWASEAYRVEEGKAAPVNSSIGFDLTVTSLYLPLINGGSVDLLPEEDGVEALATFLSEERGCSLVKITPAHLEMLAQQLRGREVEGGAGALVIGGEELKNTGLKYWRERARGTRLINEYGPTETVVGCCVYEVNGNENGDGAVPIGRPIANTQMYILGQDQEPAPVGVKGEIYISGKGVARGYIASPELTGKKFLPNPFSRKGGERWYRAGDFGRYRADGNIEFLGRADGQVKVRGRRIELGEIGTVLNEHQSVKQSIVITTENERGDKRLIGYVVGEKATKSAELKRHLRERLPEYMIPDAIVVLKEMPLTANGKIDWKKLSLVGDAVRQVEQEYIAPRTPMEEMVVGVFRDVLGLDQVGIHDNFFEIGGHSLLAIQVISRVRDAFEIEVGMRGVFDAPTVEGLSRTIEEAMRGGDQAQAPPVVRIERDRVRTVRAPMSFAQQRLWFIDRLNPDSALYNISGALRLEGGLSLDTLERVINEIVRRHEALRTRFEVNGGDPVQVIDAWEPRKLEVVDLTAVPPRERETEVNRRAIEELGNGFDLARGPLLRVTVLKAGEEDHVLLYTMHHIVSDEWSTGILIKEVRALYQAYLEGEESPLPELEIQYTDFAVWQRAHLAGELLEREVAYWREQLKSAAVLEIPLDRPRPAEPSYRGGVEEINLDASLSEGLKRLSRREGTTLFMTLMAAFKVVLMRYSGQEDISVGTAVANRTRREFEELIGFFVNTLVMRTDLSGNPNFRELLRRERDAALGAYAHQELPFEKLVEELNPERDLSRTPLFQVMLLLQHAGREILELPGVKLRGIGAVVKKGGEAPAAKFDITLSITDLGRELAGGVEYSLDLFEAKTINRLINHYTNLLVEVVKEHERPIWSLDLLSEAERKQLIEEWNATEAPYSKEKLIHELFEERVEKSPRAVALVFGEQSLTYSQLNARANRLAWRLRELGVGPEARAAVCMERGIEMVVALLATLKAGAAYVPLDPDHPSERLAHMLLDSEPVVLLTHGAAAAAPANGLSSISIINLESDEAQWISQSEQNLEVSGAGSDERRLAYIIYTSGSTGTPKGAMNEHRGVLNRLLWMQEAYGLGPDDAVLQKTPFSFDVSVWEFFWPLLYGARLVMARPGGHRDPAYLARIIREHEVTTLHFVPSMLQKFLEISEAGACCELARVICSGETLPASLARRFYDLLPESELHNLYGPTEAAIDVTAWNCKDAASSNGIPIGRPVANTSMYILDVEQSPSPIKVAGELYIGGVQVGRGYHRRSEMTAERFLPGLGGREPGERIYKTGDQGWWLPEGAIEFLGRNDYQVKIRGARIELGEIETRLSSYPNVRETVVVAREEGESGGRLVAYYTGEKVGVEALRIHMAAALPEYMTPSAYVHLDSLPITANGKLDRRALPAPEGGAYLARDYEAPKGETESTLAQIWAETLKIERVGRHDNFFELGGHSLLAVTMIERMRAQGMRSDVRTLFTAPTLRALARAVKGARASEVETPPSLIPTGCGRITPEMLPLIALTQPEIDAVAAMTPGGAANIQDIYPLAPLQEGILFHHLMSAERDAYLLSCLLAFDTRERLEGFISALQAVIARHDILRTAVMWEGLPEPAQVVWREAPLIVEDVRLNPENGEIDRQLQSRFDPSLHQLDVRKAPLIRGFAAFDAARERWLLLCLSHHLTIDHATLEIMTGEAQAHLAGEADRLPEPLPFRNFVAQARLRNRREEHEAFFREMLGDVDEAATPFGLTGGHGNGSEIEEAQFELEIGLSRRLRERARILGVSAASLCHLAWAMMLSRVSAPGSKRNDVVFGTVLLGRMQGDEGAERTLGLFINTLPVRIRVDDEGVERSARRVHRLLAELIGHEHASLALAQRCSGVEAPAPLFSALLNYRHSPREMEADAETVRAWTGVTFLASEERTNYPLTLSIDDLGDGFTLTAQTTAVVGPLRVHELLRTTLERLVDALEKVPEIPVRAIDALPEAERRQIVEEWNATEADYPKKTLLHELFEEQAEKSSEAIALVCEEQSLTYGELNARANRLAYRLRTLGIGPESRAAICLERSLEMVTAMLATLKAGGAYVPLDPAYPSERLAYMLKDSAPVVLLTRGQGSAALSAQAHGVCTVDLDAYSQQSDSHSEANPDSARSGLNADCLAYILYTSGSTGLPKGVAIEHRSVVNFIWWAKSAFEADELERTLFSTSINFDLAVYECFVPLTVGATSTIVRNALDLTRSPLEATLINTVPSAMKSLVDAGVVPRSIRTVNLAGEALKQELVERIFAETAVRSVCNLYGPSETTTYSTWTAMKRGNVFDPHIGGPIANTEIYILDEGLMPSPVGVTGEIHIGGEGRARGYLNHPEMTAERFAPDHFGKEPGDRVYKTGDLGRWTPAGKIEFLGRNDLQVKIRGYRIELGEIESGLMRHPEVQEAIVEPREDEDGGKSLIAYYTGRNVGAETLRGRILSELPEYMAPSAYVHLERLPLTPNGKLDRRRLPAPESGAYLTRGYETPRGETEIRIARIWAETLNIERVGRRDNFFELGGHSLLAMTMVERMRGEGMKSDVQTLFTAPTLRALAEAVNGREESEAPTPPNLIPERCQRITPEMLTLVELTQPEIDSIVDGVAGGALNVQDIYPLTPLQEGMLFHHLLDEEGDVYLSPSLFAFDTRERLERFVGALQAVIDRHDILRAGVQWDGLSAPVQVVWRKAPLAFEEVSFDPTVVDVAVELYARFNPRRCRLDVRKAPLMRVFIADDPRKGRWVMFCLFHHLWFDHTTLEALQREIQSHLLGRTEQSPAPPPFRNFVAKTRLGVSREEHEKFFRQMLGDVDESTAPYGVIDAQGDGSGVSEARREVDAALNSRLRRSARALRVSPASLCHLAWALTLGRVSRRDDVVFGTILFGRLHGVEGADRALGMLINTLPIRIRVGKLSVVESVRRTHQLLTALMMHEHAPLSLAQKCSGVEAPAPLFSSLFNYRYSLRETQEEASPAWEGIEILASEERTNYPLVLSIDDLGDGLALTAETAAHIDPWRICDYMLTALEGLVEALVAAPETATREIEAMPEAERRQVLETWNATESNYPAEKLLHQLFEEQTDRAPDGIAGVNEDAAISYGELNRRANQLGNFLNRQGVGAESRVGICLERGIEMLVALLGILKSGGTYAPLDPAYPAERLKFMQEDSAVRLIVTQEKIGRLLGSTTAELILIDRVCDEIAAEDEKNLNNGVESENLAYVIYTSGSTGRPKGTMITHQSVVNLVTDAVGKLRLDSKSRFLQFASLSFDVAVEEIYPAWSIGGAVVLLSNETPCSYSDLTETLDRLEITVMELPTAYWREWMRDLSLRQRKAPRSLNLVITGDERISSEIFNEWKKHEISLLHVYGMTEATVNSIVKLVPADFNNEEHFAAIPIGLPLANTEVYLLDEWLQPMPLSISGEIYLGGVGLARGYQNRPELTAEKFAPSPFGKRAGKRLYKSGDLARYSTKACLEFIGRLDYQVKIRGFRVELGEIETALDEHALVKKSVVIVSEDERGDRRLIGYAVATEGATESSLKKHVRERLPEHMVPEAILLVDEIPLTANGKIDRKKLQSEASLRSMGRRTEHESVASRTQLEEIVAGIFGEVLNRNRVGLHDNFFELGGHSLLAMQAISRVRNAFGVEIGVRSIFEESTAEGLSRKIEEAMRAGETIVAPPLIRIEREGVRRARAPLSYAQQRLWFIEQVNPGKAIYNIPGAVRLEGSLSLDALERAINEIVRRHEVLRTRIEVESGEPAQVIDEWAPRRLEVEDLMSLPPQERETKLGKSAREELERGFDLSCGPLLRVKVLKAGEEDHVLLYTMHHIVSDEWSLGILIKELRTLYQAYLKEEESPLPELEIQYADFAIWQRAYLAGNILEREVEYWKKRLKDAAVLEFPVDRPRPAEPSYRGGFERIEVGASLSENLRRLSQREGATFFMALMAAFKVVLMRYSGQEDVSVGTAIANRTRREVEGLIGFFVNTMVMRTDLSGNPSFRELLRRERDVALGAYAHQEAPFEKLVEGLNPQRDLSQSPLFQVMMLLEHAGQTRLELPGVKLRGGGASVQKDGSAQLTKFDLTLSLTDFGQEVAGAMEYSQDLFEAGTIERLINHYIHVLDAVVEDNERPIWSLDLLGERERKQIVEEWNATEVDYPREKLIHELFEDQAEKRPDAIALVCEEQSLTYCQLNARANSLANHLRGLGVGPEVRAAICLERSLEMAVALLGALKAGAAYLPLDPGYPSERLAYLLEDAQVPVLLSQQRLHGNISGQGRPVVYLDSDWEQIARCGAEPPKLRPQLSGIAYVIFTSGSTGQPKGVVVEHRQILNYVAAIIERLEIGPDSNFAMVQPLTFDSCATVIYPALATGSCLHVLTREQATDPQAFKQYFSEHEIDLLKITPSHLAAMQTGMDAEKVLPRRWLVIGGESSGSEWVERLRRMRPDCRILSHYGPTEATVGMLTYDVERDRSGFYTAVVPVGRPLDNTQAYALDRWMQPLPAGVGGELYIGGLCVARGYLNHPEITAERFIPDLYGKERGGRLYKTGDQVRRLPDGNIEYLGRLDRQVKIRGFRIEPGEIESALLQNEAIKEAVVIARGEAGEEKRLIAYLTARNGYPIGQGELRSHLKRRLPDYMTPAAFVVMEKLPLMSNGKLDHRALPAPDIFDHVRRHEPPIGAAETTLAKIWAEVLKLERVGRNDNFFELGGHSLLAVSLIEKMRQEGMNANVRALFTDPTLSGFTAAVGGQSGLVEVPPNRIPLGCKAITPEMLSLANLSAAEIDLIVSKVPGGAGNVQDIYPLAPLQEGVLFHYLLETDGDPYLGRGLFRFDSQSRRDSFLQALQRVIDRHDILRTAVQWEGLEEPAQVVWRHAPLVVEEIRFDAAAGDVGEQLRSRFDPRRYRLDISQAPMMRACIAPTGNTEGAFNDSWLMLLLFQHMVLDHITMEILLKEIQAHLTGNAEQLPESPPFRNFVAQARLGIGREEHETFFREMLGDVDEPTTPFGLTDAQRDGSGIKEALLDLEIGLSGRLRERARFLGVSVATLCHLACALVLGRVSGRDDVVFGTVLLGRMQSGVGSDRAPGMFINTLPIRIRLGTESVRDGVLRTHSLLTQLMRHEHASLALAQRCSAVAAPSPLFSAYFNYRHNPAPENPVDAVGEQLQAWEGIEALGSEQTSNYPFSLSVDDWGGSYTLGARAQSPIDTDRVCAYMSAALEQIITALEHAHATPMRDLDVLSASERRQLLVEWNDTETEYPRDRCIQELFAERAEGVPERIALVCEGHWLSYGELNRRANKLGNLLRSLGIGPEAVVGVSLERSVEMGPALLGTLKAGGAYLPLDPETPVERLGYVLENAGVGVALTHRNLKSRLSAFKGEIVCLDEEWEKIDEESEWDLERQRESQVDAENLAYVIYTSGSTGRPKGVMVRHRSLVNYSNDICRRLGLEEGEAGRELRFATVSTIAADLGNTCIYPSLLSGGCLHILSYEDATDGSRYAEYLRRDQVDVLKIVPSHLNALLGSQGDEVKMLPSRFLILGGETLSREFVERIQRRGEGCAVINHYGPTETTIGSLTAKAPEMEEAWRSATAPIGRPIANTTIYISDREWNPAPLGVRGELHLSGEGVARGYLKRPDLTAERFVPNPFSQKRGERVYRTGDQCRYSSDGKVEFLGRADNQVKIRGYRVELSEIETVLNGQGRVRQSVVLAQKDEKGHTRLIAYVAGEEDLTPAELRRHVLERLPAYMAPEDILILKEMPVTANGKIDRKKLSAMEGKGRYQGSEYVGPRTPVEEILLEIFEEVLNLDRVGIHDDFFENGGHSLLATRVISRIRSTFDVEIGVRNIFDKTTVAKLADVLIAQEPSPGRTEKIAMILKRLDGMTDQDMIAELAAIESDQPRSAELTETI